MDYPFNFPIGSWVFWGACDMNKIILSGKQPKGIRAELRPLSDTIMLGMPKGIRAELWPLSDTIMLGMPCVEYLTDMCGR